MALALNNLKRVDMPLNKEIKTEIIDTDRQIDTQIAQSAGAVEYTDCTSAEG